MNLTEFFYQDGKKQEKILEFPFKKWGDEEILNSPQVSLILTNIEKGKAEIEGKATVAVILPCDRCLKPVKVEVELDFSREVLAPEQIPDEDVKEEQLFVNEYELDLDSLLKEELQLAWPSKILCKEECKGICKKCGQDLNEQKCDCDDFVPDVRFANLMDIFNASQKN